jgi:hypothetical protein
MDGGGQWHGIAEEFTANSHLYGWFGLRIRGASWNHDPITTVVDVAAFAGGTGRR